MTTGSKSLRDRISPVVRDLPRSGIRDFFELVTFLEEHRKEYVRFILTGEAD